MRYAARDRDLPMLMRTVSSSEDRKNENSPRGGCAAADNTCAKRRKNASFRINKREEL